MPTLVAEPVKAKQETTKYVAVVCSIFPEDDGKSTVVLNRSYHPVILNICEKGQEFALTVISPVTATTDIGDDRKQTYEFSAREIGEDVCQELNTRVMGAPNSFLGFFVCKGLEPTKTELADAKEKLERTLLVAVKNADAQWTRMPHHELIHDLARRGAKYMGLDKPWLYKTEILAECPACGEKLKTGVALCKSCGCIIDHKKAEALGMVEKESKQKKQTEA